MANGSTPLQTDRSEVPANSLATLTTSPTYLPTAPTEKTPMVCSLIIPGQNDASFIQGICAYFGFGLFLIDILQLNTVFSTNFGGGRGRGRREKQTSSGCCPSHWPPRKLVSWAPLAVRCELRDDCEKKCLTSGDQQAAVYSGQSKTPHGFDASFYHPVEISPRLLHAGTQQ